MSHFVRITGRTGLAPKCRTGAVSEPSERPPAEASLQPQKAFWARITGLPRWLSPRVSSSHVAGSEDSRKQSDEKAERRAALSLISAYHQDQLRALLERVRSGFERLDAGEIDEFELDELIHHYKRSTVELWKFCGYAGGSQLQAARTLTYLREEGREPDWWEAGASRRDRSQ